MRELRVRLQFSASDLRDVGTLAEGGHRVWFEYDPLFANSGLEISPLRLPLSQKGLIEHPVRPGIPIPGVFNDARPEGWGLKLLHRAFQERGQKSSSALEDLAFLGSNTMGALVFEPASGPQNALDEAVELAALAAHAQKVWDDRVQTVLPRLVRAGGPSGGARPKALIGLPKDGGPGFRFGEGPLPEGWEAWLVKFPTSSDDNEVARREAAWMAMAEAAGINIPRYQILRLEDIGDSFAVRRFDRPGDGRRLHMLSGAGALNVDFRRVAADYSQLLRASQHICKGDQSQVLALYRLALFNVAACNEDDHLKNVGWLLDPDKGWRLSPGFDLTYSPSPRGERWTTVGGSGRNIGREQALRLAEGAGIKSMQAEQILEQVTNATAKVQEHLGQWLCKNPVSWAAAGEVEKSTARLRGGR
jgi:serine/threonine-protein kinase HipA